ncbi:hypothetical protein K8O92_24780 [Nocardia asteroides]|nr:hypothetical protein K8O92_24780 [Nocardia asteroides]
MTIIRSLPDPPGDATAGGSGFRTNRAEIGRFGHPLTRMLLASDGSTMPVLEAILRTDLQVHVLRQEAMAASRLPTTVTDALQVSGTDRVIVRRSRLIDSDMVAVSANHVVIVPGPAAAYGVGDVRTPIGYALISRGIPQRRHLLRAGLTRWPDGRLCAAKAYAIVTADRPLCYIRESFNPNVIPPDHSYTTDSDLRWADEPERVESEPTDLRQRD